MLCSHLKIAPSCRRFPPQTRGEHLWRRSTRDARADWRGGCFHGTRTCWGHAALHALTNPIFKLLLSLKVLQLCNVGWTSGTPGNLPVTPANSVLQPHMPLPRSPGVLGAEACSQEALMTAETELCHERLQTEESGNGLQLLILFLFVLSSYKNLVQKCLGCSSTTLSEYRVLSIASSSV